MKLGDLIKGYGNYETIRETYTDVTPGQVLDMQEKIIRYIQEELLAYVETLEYPKTVEDIHRNYPLVSVPEHIRLAVVQQLDDLVGEKDVLLKFEMYMIMVSFVGDQISAGYKQNYDKAVRVLQGDPDKNFIQKRNLN